MQAFAIIGIVLAFILGFLTALFVLSYWIVGSLRVVASKEDGPYLFLEIDKHKANILERANLVIVRIKRSSDSSQK